MFSRPGVEETEENLLRSQEEFLAGRLNPSATVVRASREDQTVSQSAGDKRILSADERDVVTLEGLPRVQPSTSSNHGFPPKKKSKFKERHQNKNEQDREEHLDCADLLDIHDRHMTSVLSQIKERDIQSRHVMAPRVSQKGFPVALHREDVGNKKTSTLKENSSESKKSLFAQQFAVSGSVSFGVPAQLTKSLQTLREASKDVKEVSNGTAIFFRSSLISGEGLVGCAGERGHLNQAVEEIHTENMAKLESMTEDEILEEQARIKSTIDPSLIAFLTSRHKNNNCKSELMHADTTVDERKDKNIENASCAAGESSHSGKHVHFSDNVQMIPQENQQGIITANEQHEQSGDCMTIGDLRVSRQWLHMDTVETEKLEWMKDCPVPSAVDSEQGDQARFDFDGNLLSKIDSIPEYIGLHHHGHDPSAAGYSLEELFVLARSSFLQQRVFALQVLARIIKQDQLGNFEGHLSDNLLSLLLDAGVLFLLRWALDDASEAVVAVAVQGLAAALIIPSDKESADQLFSFPRGHEVPALRPTNEKKEDPQNNEDKEEEKGLTDAEILKQDAVKGLIQMNILPRLRYILEVCSPATPTVCDILDVLTRISQHSTQVASEVLKCPRLVQTIFENFLPLSWEMVDQTGPVRGHPVSSAMQLVRSLCCAGRHVAATLISKYKLLDRILRYTALTPRNMQLSTEEAFLLYVESLRSWRVCVLYGLGCDAVRELYSFFIEHMQAIQSLSIFAKTPEERSELSCASAMFGLVEAVIYAAGTGTDQKSQINVSEQEEDNRNVALASLLLNWSHVTGFLPLIVGCVTKWIKEILECNKFEIQSESLCLLSGAVAALTAFYSLSPDQSQAFHSPVEILQQLEHLANVVLLPLINSEVLDSCFMEISSSHDARGPKLCRKAIPSLPDYGSLKLHRKPGTQSPKVSVKELVGFASSWLQLFCQVAKQHKGIAPKFSTVLCKEAIVKYLKLVVKSSEVGVCFFFRQEHHLQYYLLKLAYNEVELTDVADFAHIIPLLHEVALLLFAKILPGDEFYAFDLLSTVLLHSKFLCGNEGLSTVDVTEDLSEMSLATPPMPSTYDTATVTRGELIAEAHKNLPSIRSMFVGSLQGTGRVLDISRSLTLHHVRRVQSFLLPPCTEPLQPADWMFLPVVDLHNQAVSVEMKGKDIDTISEPAVSIVTRTLKLVLMLEQWRPSCLRHVSMASRIARLMCVFLTGNDLFFNSEVHDYLSVLLRMYTSPSKLKQLDFNSSIPGLTSFYDLYASLLAQFSAVSFGDPLFACFLILPLTQRHDIKFRKAVWEEHVGVLRALSIPLDQLPIPMEEFLYPVEQNQALLALYLRTLATQGVRPLWSPLFYLIAVHHVNSFVFQRIDPSDDSELKKKIAFLKQVLLVQNEEREHKLSNGYSAGLDHPCSEASQKKERLSNQDVLRYSRQLILPEIGVKGQIKLCNASVLIVGAGGLGCPAAQYLAAAGVGCIGIVDYDTVEVSNLHRQVLHTEERVNISKAESIKIQLNQLNSSVQCIPYCMQLTSSNAIKIIENYDVVLDATDNVATRYLLSDSCVMAGKPLVSGSALRFEGQLTVYNYADGPCYRCLFPSPPPPESVGNCSDSGVLGPVPGIIGTLQALEAIKIAVGIKSSFSQKMLVYDALEGRFLTVKLRQRQQSCPICGDNPTINELHDYELFCGASATDKTPSLKLLSKQQRISVQEYKEILDQCAPHVLLDVREPVELDICHLPKSLNIPLKHLRNPESHEILKRALLLLAEEENTCNFRPVNVYVLCKEGNDSQKAVKILREQFYRDYTELLTREETSSPLQADSKQDTIDESRSFDVVFKDIAGGLYAWAQHIDKEFPIY